MDVTDFAGLEPIADVRGPRKYRLEAVVKMMSRLLCDLVQQGVRAVLGWRCAGRMGWRRSRGAMAIGLGSNSVIAQILATALGADVRDLALVGPDTDVTPDAGKTSAPLQTFVSGNAAWLAGVSLRAMILERCNAAVDAVLRFGRGVVEVAVGVGVHRVELADLAPDGEGYVLRAEERYDPPTLPLDANEQGAPYAQFGYAAHLVVVEVDLKLGLVKPLRFVAAHDVGRAINPLLVEGQVQGGIAQGLGMALPEEYRPGRTENLHDYLIPTIGDVPPIETLIIEEANAHGPYGAKGLGEHVLIPTAPAILNAIRHATGVAVSRVPATPSRVRAALREAGYE
jgi:aldehyde oxidoreductase